MQIKRLGPPEAQTLLEAAYLFDAPPIENAVLAYLQDERNIFLLALEDRRPVGFLRGTALTQVSSERRQMFIYEIGVAAASRRQGVGTALVRALLEHCRAEGFEEAFVLANPENDAAVHLYRSTGGVPETPADRMYVYRLD